MAMSYKTELRNKNRGYMNLIVWQKAMELFELAWKIACIETKLDFKLRSQFVDAVQSVSSNMAKGYGRRSVNEYIQYLYISLGSLGENLTRAFGLNRVGQITDPPIPEFDLLHHEVENRLLRLIEKLEQKRDDGDWIARISEDPEEYRINSLLHHSITPSLRLSSTPALQS